MCEGEGFGYVYRAALRGSGLAARWIVVRRYGHVREGAVGGRRERVGDGAVVECDGVEVVIVICVDGCYPRAVGYARDLGLERGPFARSVGSEGVGTV